MNKLLSFEIQAFNNSVYAFFLHLNNENLSHFQESQVENLENLYQIKSSNLNLHQPYFKLPPKDLYSELVLDEVKFEKWSKFTPKEFQDLLEEVGPAILFARNIYHTFSRVENNVRRLRKCKNSLANRLLLFLIWMESGKELRELEADFHISSSTINAEIKHVRQALYHTLFYEMQWPDEEKRKKFYGLVPGFEKCIGFLDGTCIKIRKPKINQDLYYRGDKKFHNILNQLVVDPFGRNIHLTFGGEGSNNDRGFFTMSPLYTHQEKYFSSGEFLLADGGYQGDGPVVCPFNHNEAKKTEGCKEFNKVLRASRISVEWGFGFIKNKWKVFQNWKYEKDELGVTLYVACLLANRLFRIRNTTLVTPQTIQKRFQQFGL